MSRLTFAWLGVVVLADLTGVVGAWGQETRPAKKYFGHPVVEDRYGVIAPWYHGQNGQCDFRLRISEETLKRYPWTEPGKAVMAAPHFVFNGQWTITPDGAISVNPELKDWDNGDVGQRTFGLLCSQIDYYRYSGDPAALGIVTLAADYVLDYCQTAADHPWPRFFISVPNKGKAYGRADPHGFIQIDISACVGIGMVGAYKLTGNARYWEAAKHWADLFAEHCNPRPGLSPWPRYANPEDVPAVGVGGVSWGPANKQTASAAVILRFLDEVIRTGYAGKDDSLIKARDAGDAYLRDVVLPEWSGKDTFGCYYWDWDNSAFTPSGATFVSQYMLSRPEVFPNWRTDVRNIMSFCFCRLSVNPESMGGVYSGAWAFPEAHNCCAKVLQYPVATVTPVFARYAAMTDDAWAKEIARREVLLWTYDMHETGMIEDIIDGGVYVAAIWFNCGHTWPFRALLDHMAWQPELTGAGRENHIMRSTSIVTNVRYGKGRVAYTTYEAPAPSEDVLRLAFVPKRVTADGKVLQKHDALTQIGYTVKELANGDCVVTIRHDGGRAVVVEGDDPQRVADDSELAYEGAWTMVDSPEAAGGSLQVAEAAGASASFEFEGNQVRLIGRADSNGGKADVYLDGVKQLCGIDFWSPVAREQQVLCYKNGLAQGKHTLKIVAFGAKNPLAGGTRTYVDAMQWSAAQGNTAFGEGGGPSDAQRVIFGYMGRKDFVDAQGKAWRPGLEFVMRLGVLTDPVPLALWTEPRIKDVGGTSDPELYRYGVHGKDFTVYFTVDPKAKYFARIKLCEVDPPSPPLAKGGKAEPPSRFITTIDIQGKTVASDVNIAATAGGVGKAADLVFNGIEHQNGVIAIRFWNRAAGEAMVQAIEIGPGPGGAGARPVSGEALLDP